MQRIFKILIGKNLNKGYDPDYGTRPLKRAIQDLVLDELSLQIIEDKLQEGSKVVIDVKWEKLEIVKK